MPDGWPETEEQLVAFQQRLAGSNDIAVPWAPTPASRLVAGGCFVAYASGQAGPGSPGDRAWAAAVTWQQAPGLRNSGRQRRAGPAMAGSGPGLPRQARDVLEQALVSGTVGARYRPGLLALREGPLLDRAVRALQDRPAVLLVDATGTDHPRRAGLAVHLGAVLDMPTVGVTHRPLLASGALPDLRRGAASPVTIDGDVVGHWLCTRTRARPVVVHAAWRTTAETALEVVLACSTEGARTPVPLGEARRVAREARAVAEGRVSGSPHERRRGDPLC